VKLYGKKRLPGSVSAGHRTLDEGSEFRRRYQATMQILRPDELHRDSE
jgi:hypothetical protein